MLALVNRRVLSNVRSQHHGQGIDVHKVARETMLDLFGLKPTSTVKNMMI